MPMRILSVKVSEDMYRRLKQAAEKSGVSMGEIVRIALDEYLREAIEWKEQIRRSAKKITIRVAGDEER